MQFKETYKTLFASLLPQLVSEIVETSMQNAELTIPSTEKDVGMEELISQEKQKIMAFLEENVIKSGKFDMILANFEDSIKKFMDLKQTEIHREEIEKENAALVEEAISRAISQKANSPVANTATPPGNSLSPPPHSHTRINSAGSVGSSNADSGTGTPDKAGRETSKKEHNRRGSGFGFKNMLSSLTKSRPSKPSKSSSKSKGLTSEKSLEGEPTAEDDAKVIQANQAPQFVVSEPSSEEKVVAHDESPAPPPRADSTPLQDTSPVVNAPEPEERPSEVQPKKYVPTNAMAAMAMAMRSGLSSTTSLEKAGLEDEPKHEIRVVNPEEESNNEQSPSSSVPSDPRPKTPQSSAESSKASSNAAPAAAPIPPPRSRPTSIATDDPPTPPTRLHSESLATDSAEPAPPVPAIRPRPNTAFDLQTPDVPPKPAAKPRPATWFDAPPSDTSSGHSPHSGDLRNSMRPLVLPRPVSSYNPAVQPVILPQIPDKPVDLNSLEIEEDNLRPVRTKEEEARHQLALKAHKSSPVKPLAKPLLAPTGHALSFKKKENSTSGDDKAIEKKAIEWLNTHLASQEIVVDDIVKGLGEGLYLIYALEDATGASVGKYNKKAKMEVHKLDNCSVALSFLVKHGVNTQVVTPRDILDGNKGKILSLFNAILTNLQEK